MKWNLEKLGDVFLFIRNGASIKQEDGKSGVPITRIETIANGQVDETKLGYADVVGEQFSDYYLQENDILMSHINSWIHLGKCALVPKQERAIIHGMNLLLLRPNNELVDANFIKHYFGTINFKAQLHKISNQSVNQSSFAVTKLKELSILLPTLPAQQKIAVILDGADALRRKDKALLAKYDELLQAVFYDMFGDPVKNEKGWEVKQIKDITENLDSYRKPVKSSDRAETQGIYPYYGATGVIDYVNEYLLDGQFLLISEDGKNLVGRYKKIAFIATGKIWVNNHAHVLNSRKNCNNFYLEHFLNVIDLKQYVTGIDQFKLNRSNLDIIPILVPPIKLQNEFAAIVQNIENQKAQIIKQQTYSENLFQSLMQQAFKGELVS